MCFRQLQEIVLFFSIFSRLSRIKCKQEKKFANRPYATHHTFTLTFFSVFSAGPVFTHRHRHRISINTPDFFSVLPYWHRYRHRIVINTPDFFSVFKGQKLVLFGFDAVFMYINEKKIVSLQNGSRWTRIQARFFTKNHSLLF